MKINSFAEAKSRLQELSDAIKDVSNFLEVADSAITVMSTLKRGAASASPAIAPKPKSQPQLPPEANGAPLAMTERVLQLIREAGKPLMPKDVVEIYASKGWPRPEDGREFYMKISGSMAYLTKRKKVVAKTAAGYVLL